MNKIPLIISIIWMHFSVFATQCFSTGDGDWNDPSSWSCGAVPQCGDTIVINFGDKITIDDQINLDECPEHTVINVEGELAFTNGNKLTLGCNSTFSISPDGIVYKDGPGGGNSTLIEQCGSNIWTASDGDFEGPYNWGGGLPIELISFNAKANIDHVLLRWVTASETNNDYFTIEKSKDGLVFTPIAIIEGAGNSSTEITYQEKDLNPLHGVSYYRLKQTDFNGDTSYSKIKSVEFIKPDFKLYPNPSVSNNHLMPGGDRFTILGENMDDYSLQVYTLDGKTVPVNFRKEQYQITFEGLKESGTYIVRLYNQADHYHIRLIVR